MAVRINGIEDKGGVANVNLDIICEKANHKPILIGKRGSAIKEVSQMAREDMEKFLGKKVFLTTYVRVEENWRARPALLKENGYTDEE